MILVGMLACFAMVDVDDCGLPEHLGELLIVRGRLKELGDLVKKDRSTSLIRLGKDCIRSWDVGWHKKYFMDDIKKNISVGVAYSLINGTVNV